METIFEHKPWTDWVVIISDRHVDKEQEVEFVESGHDFAEFTGTFRTGFREGKECEMFTLLLKDMDYACLWINIFKNGNIEYVSHIPSVVQINKRKKQVQILPLVYVEYDINKNSLVFKHIPDFESNVNIMYKRSYET